MIRFPWLKTPQGPTTAYDREVFAWASLYWPDLRATWSQFREYYTRQFKIERERRGEVMATSGYTFHQTPGEPWLIDIRPAAFGGHAVRIGATIVECAWFWTVDRTSTQELVDAFCEAAIKAGFRLPVPKDDAAEEPYVVAEMQG